GTNAGVADVLEPLDYDLHVFGGGGSRIRDAEWWVQIFALPRERATELAPVVAALSSLTDGDHHAQARTRTPLAAIMPRISSSTMIADALARLALRTPPLERALVAGTRNPLLRRHLRLGAVAMGYPRVLGGREWRIAEMDGYRFYVNVGESPLGVEPYFFRNTGAVWLRR